MPVYDYHCESCSHDFAVTESIARHGRAKVTCPKCKSPKVERVFTPFYAKTVRKS
jgi:putative FmdB family regulatory protein